ncbi:hypothetical protein F443_12051 [Phytophthora nicotianae P1569]|uniref:Jacalin-type lectin domain-containing protein n=1 Tax=Phytophthora nicotianae P1569 TaxID=1317065 RepID=V9EUD7_PHYNI|nr:hypothetical protein F443_12051 [Phytophthora nicotianae P1569]
MNYVVTWYALLSLFVMVSSSTPEFGFHSISTPTAAASNPVTSQHSNYSTSNTTDPTSSSVSGSASGSTNPRQITINSATTAVSTFKSTYTNWVGPVKRPSDTACYREAHIGKTCPLGFNSKWDTCWAQCPMEFPVKCGMECIRQNDDCKLEIVTKTAYVFQSVMAMSLFNVYGEFKLMAKAVRTAFRCAKEMANLVKHLSKFVRNIMVTDPQTTQEKALDVLYQTDNVVFDIPVTVAECMGIVVKADPIRFYDKITNTGELILRQVMADKESILESWDSFKNFMKKIALGESISDLKSSEITSLERAMKSNSTCGHDMKRIADRAWMTVLSLRNQNPQMSENELRVYMSKSNLVLNDIPVATNNCMEELIAESGEAKAYQIRNTLRTTLGVIVEDLIKSGTSNNGTYLTAEHYAYKIADKAASFYGVWDIKGIGNMIGEFLQTICGPTKFIGEIDDGPANSSLGLKTDGKAFNRSSGIWTKEGDGTVTLMFQSSDTKDVTVNIHSGGGKIDEVDVSRGGSATWTSNVTTLGGKTLYLDRWRPGLLGLPGTGGGSLVLWIPQSTESGGHLDLKVKLNVS